MTRATAALVRAAVPHRVHRYPRDPRADSFGAEAVAALCAALAVAPERVLKTLVIAVDARLGLAVLPVPQQLDVKAAAAALGGRRAELADTRTAERATGYVLGGVSPLGLRTALPTVLDVTALAHPTVLCSAGQRGLELELDPAELVRLTGAVVATITRG